MREIDNYLYELQDCAKNLIPFLDIFCMSESEELNLARENLMNFLLDIVSAIDYYNDTGSLDLIKKNIDIEKILRQDDIEPTYIDKMRDGDNEYSYENISSCDLVQKISELLSKSLKYGRK